MVTKRLSLVSIVVGLGIASITGCTASTVGAPAKPAAMDASWSPPEAVDVAIKEGSPHASGSNQANARGDASYRPNRQPIPQSGAVHAAIY